MMGMASRDKGGWFGIAVDADGFIGESCVGNIAAVIDGTLVTPPFEGILAGTTTRRTLEMAARGRFAAVLPGGAQQRRLHADEARSSAAELMILGGDTHVMPIVKYDGKTPFLDNGDLDEARVANFSKLFHGPLGHHGPTSRQRDQHL